jgi:hypothetical protein
MKSFKGFIAITQPQVITFLIITFIGIIAVKHNIYAQPCNKKGIVNKDTKIYDKAPEVITGRGLVYGKEVGALKNGITIYICQEVTIGFGFSTQLWYHIAYWNNEWSFAWVSADDIRIASTQILPWIEYKFALISQAWAETSSETRLSSQVTPTSPPPEQAPPSLPHTGDSGTEVSSGPLIELYIWLFTSMVIGMVAKGLYDTINSTEISTIKDHLRGIVAPILVSPMVFLSLMQYAEVIVNQQKFIVLLFLAFQNGFFWKTLLDRVKI